MKLRDIFMAFKDLEKLDNEAYALFNENVYEKKVGAKLWDATEILKYHYFMKVTGAKDSAYNLSKEIKTGNGMYFSDEVGEILRSSKSHKECKLKLKSLYYDFKENNDV